MRESFFSVVKSISAVVTATLMFSASLLAQTDAPAAPGNALYRCQQGRAITIQDTPCPKGATERKIEYSRTGDGTAPAPILAPPAAAPPAATTPAAPAPAAQPVADPPAAPEVKPETNNEAANVPPQNIAAAEPPPLWRCSDALNGDERLIEQLDTNRRCVPLGVLGYNLSGMPTEAAGACRWIEDQCTRLQGDQGCKGWRRYLEKATSDLKYAFSDTQDARRAQFNRVEGVVKQYCNQ